MSDIQKIGKYEIISKIADGGMGTVYKAKDTSFDERYVALKVMKPEHSKDADMRERFRREAEKSVKITHPNVVKVTDYGIDDGKQYIVMEYIDGEDLGKRLKRQGALSWEEAVHNIIDIASVIDNAHEKGIIHRDIKPGNILLDKKGHVYVTDFGIAVALQDPRITRTDEFFGSAAYMSPEHHLGKEIDRRSDIYSLGIVLYEMLTNAVPFIGNTPASTGVMHATTPPIAPKRLNPAIPDWLNDIVMKSLEKEPKKRFGNCNEFIKNLKDRKIKDNWLKYLLILSGMVVLLVIVLFLLFKESKTPITASVSPTPQPTIASLMTPTPAAIQAEEPSAAPAALPEASVVAVPAASPVASPAKEPSVAAPSAAKSHYTDPVTGMEFVLVKAKGKCYMMGSPKSETGRFDDEDQKERCFEKNFYMGKYVVTNKQFRKFRSGHDSKDYKGHSLDGDNQPVVYVSAEDADAFVKWLKGETGKNYRLPNEEEWEYACRAGTTTSRYWGDDPDKACEYANVYDKSAKNAFHFSWENHNCDDGYEVAAPVGQFKPNNFGLYDMLGNVWEWTRSSTSGGVRVLRGGSWGLYPRGVRCARRYDNSPGGSDVSLGFRLILEE